ncbi:leucine-rich repeat domain-containing protein [Pseudomonas reactans]|uniref:NEL-type E3 ubiquitin ligase domain-containing protein n=1 Tax=Pseudomonas reactans TaxID=117680 RepID=UPI0015BDDD29|nr:NEL-type E3 ubiquitin ligase domain-containing protein [Pseudomonas reactans]NWD80662.1 leucine-rich repeat domain-containing protein [Pseudomonas reactans]
MPETLPSDFLHEDAQGVHYDFLKERIPAWFREATPQRQQELAKHKLQLPAWYAAARPVLAADHGRMRETLNSIESRLGAIEDIVAFAEPKLKAAIKQQFNLDLDVRQVYFARKYEREGPGYISRFVDIDETRNTALTARYWGHSLLEAALANFEASEEQPLRCSDCQIITTWASYDDEVIPTFSVLADHAVAITPHGFARLCRTLDLGAKYQAHIKALVQPADNVQRQALEQQLEQYPREQFSLETELLGFHSTAVSAEARSMLMQLLANPGSATLDKKPVVIAGLKVFDSVLVGPLLIGPDRQSSSQAERLVVYLPNDPVQSLKEYANSGEFMADLRARLHSASYRRFFSRFIPAREQGTFFQQFNTLYLPEGTDRGTDYPLQSRLPRLPTDEFRIAGELWKTLRESQVRKIFADARSVAVPAGDEDRQARLQRLQGYADAVVNVFNLAAFAVPGLGPLMLTVGAAQLTDEVFEGIEAYEHGEPIEMWAHFSSVAMNVAAAVTGAIVLPQVQISPQVDRLKPVTMDSGEQKLWRPDLEPYKATIALPADARPNALGLYTHEGKTVLAHEGDHYQVRHDPLTDDYRIQHPTRPQAYAPRLEHNHEQAWLHELEQPLTWDHATLLRRLGLPAEGVSSERLRQASEASGVEADTLRGGYFEHQPAPLVLADTLQRFKLADAFEGFIMQMKSTDPAVYAEADPALQMDLLQRRGMLSDTPLRVMDAAGNRLWDDPAPSSKGRRVVVLSEQAMARGELLKEVLYTLQGVDPALSEFPGQPGDTLLERARLLRQYLGEQAEAFKHTLVEERYQARNLSQDPDVRLMQARYPALPQPMAEHLLPPLTEEQLQTFRKRGRLPDDVQAQVQWLVQELRVSRAYEGVFVESLANTDSQRLALHTLETLPGWQRGTRVELREHSATGPLLDAIGAPDATVRKTLVLKDNAKFEGPLPRDVYSAMWHTLTAEERLALGVTDAPDLKSQIQRSPLPRGPMRALLLDNPLRKPAYDPSMRLLGGALGIRQQIRNALRTPNERLTRLFPRLSSAQITAITESLGTDVRGGVARLEAEYATLERDLKTWVRANAQPSSITAVGRRGVSVSDYADAIKSCWRRELRSLKIRPGTPLNLPGLSANFSHVESLVLSNIPWTSEAQTFLNGFGQLKQLSIEQTAMTELPDGLAAKPNLTVLSLAGNRIRLTSTSAQKLCSLSTLEDLNRQGNPLGQPLDFSAMTRLKKADLSRTRLRQWPTGLRELTGLEKLDLSYNELRTLPVEHLEPAPEHLDAIVKINSVTDLRGNPLSSQTSLDLDSYWLRLSQNHPELMALGQDYAFSIESPTIARVRRLFPNKTIRQARVYIAGLGDRLEPELARLDQEFDTLKQALDGWVFRGGGTRQRYVRVSNARELEGGRDDWYAAKLRILKAWRGELPHETARDGTPIGMVLDLSDLSLSSLPDLAIDFAGVGSLVLKNVGLVDSPEAFLTSFRGLRWLDMSNNQLRELPPALGQMQNLTRLNLSGNQIRLTPETARTLGGLARLRALTLSSNPLGITLDFTQIPDIRTLDLRSTGLTDWPMGLGQQPLLDNVVLDNNRLTTLPAHVIAPTDEQLATSLPLRCLIWLRNNPLSEAALRGIADYQRRVELANLTPNPHLDFLLSGTREVQRVTAPSAAGSPFSRWTVGEPQDRITAREAQWLALREQPNGDGFFRMLDDLQAAEGGHADLQRRVWEVIDSITEHSVASDALRDEMFTWAGRGACCDRAALSFSNVEIMKMVYRAKASATDATQGTALFKLARGLFRLDEVEKIALADIARRTAAINTDPRLSAAQKLERIARLEEVEIRLAYRYGLKGEDKLNLPGQPSHVRFVAMGDVTSADLDRALARILALDNSPEELQALLTRDFWKDYVVNKYRAQFEAQSKPFHERLAALLEQNESDSMTEAEYLAQAKALKTELEVVETALIESLTRTEVETYHP